MSDDYDSFYDYDNDENLDDYETFMKEDDDDQFYYQTYGENIYSGSNWLPYFSSGPIALRHSFSTTLPIFILILLYEISQFTYYT